MSFPADIKGCMRDCILAVLWAKKDIYAFFKNHGCTVSDMRIIENFSDEAVTRVAVVDKMFGHLTARADGGIGQFRAILQSLLSWSHFDPYYFDKLKKLDRAVAERTLTHLRQLQEIRDAKVKEDRARREAREVEAKRPTKTLNDLRLQYLELLKDKIPRQQRGYELEKILQQIAKLSAIDVTSPFKVNGEQIDGAIKYDGEHYILEAKWHDKAIANEAVYQFSYKVEGKMYGRGLFISINGYSADVIRSLVIGKALKTILIDGEDIMLLLEEHLSLTELLDRKIKAAQTKGLIYIHPLTGKEKG